ncbi:MAG: hypothetical protein HYY92_01495 [Parcubacteria group bacterium]|nr:hypothetical protein [Parcubacteria group bacterium]
MTKTLIALVVVLLIIGGGYFLLSGDALAPEDGESDGTSLQVPAPGFENVPEMIVSPDESANARTITYTASGFSPSSLSIARGETVRFVNEGGAAMWVASALHPTHAVYDGTTLNEHCGGGGASFDQCASGSEYSFSFEKAGTWKYHNHLNVSHTGTIVVQ